MFAVSFAIYGSTENQKSLLINIERDTIGRLCARRVTRHSRTRGPFGRYVIRFN